MQHLAGASRIGAKVNANYYCSTNCRVVLEDEATLVYCRHSTFGDITDAGEATTCM